MQQFRTKPNRLVRMMIMNWAFGWAVGFVCAAGVLVSNVGHIWDLVAKSDSMGLFLVLLFGSFGLTFGGVVAATAIMLLPTDEQDMARRRRPRTGVAAGLRLRQNSPQAALIFSTSQPSGARGRSLKLFSIACVESWPNPSPRANTLPSKSIICC